MVSQVLEQVPGIRQVLSADWKTSHLVPTWEDIEELESMQKVMKPLADFTDMLSRETHVMLSALRPAPHILKNDVLAESESDTTLTADIKRHILVYLKAKYEESERSELLDGANFLHPRFTADYLDEKSLETVRKRLVREGAGFQGERAMMVTDPTLSNSRMSLQPRGES